MSCTSKSYRNGLAAYLTPGAGGGVTVHNGMSICLGNISVTLSRFNFQLLNNKEHSVTLKFNDRVMLKLDCQQEDLSKDDIYGAVTGAFQIIYNNNLLSIYIDNNDTTTYKIEYVGVIDNNPLMRMPLKNLEVEPLDNRILITLQPQDNLSLTRTSFPYY
ncbi:MAG: hypothetical protein FWE37_03520 [Spirochaetaceae bacterium]|nr:hypothetical protein [Spirochaetaceae bacterium]